MSLPDASSGGNESYIMQRTRTFKACIYCRIDHRKCIHPANEGQPGSCTRCAQKRLPCGPCELKEDSERYLRAQKPRPTLPLYNGNTNVEPNRSVPTSNTQNRNTLELQEEGYEIMNSLNTGPLTAGTSMGDLLMDTSVPWTPQELPDPPFDNLPSNYFDPSPAPATEAADSDGDLHTISPFMAYEKLSLHREHIETFRSDLEARNCLDQSTFETINNACKQIEREIGHMVTGMIELYHQAQNSSLVDRTMWMSPYLQRAMVDTDHLSLDDRKYVLLGIMDFYGRWKDTVAVDKVLQSLMKLNMVDSTTKPRIIELFAESMKSPPQSNVMGGNDIGNKVLPRLHRLVSLGITALVPALQEFAASGQTPKLDMFRRNLLHVAAEGGHDIILRNLLELNRSHPTLDLDIDGRDAAQRTPVCLAIVHGHESTYQLLKNWGAKLDVRDNTSHSLVASAASGNHIWILKDLIEAKRPVNENVLLGAYEPLHAAAEKGHLEAVQLLIKKGAHRTRLKMPERKTPSQLARDNGHTVVADEIDEAG